MMTALVSWYNEQEKRQTMHPLELASLLHYRYIRIHPFEDGNGRIARLLVNYVLLRHNYPMVIIKSERKEEYLNALRRADILVGLTPSDGANAELSQIEPFVDYMREQMEYALELCIKAAKGESLDEPGDLNKKLRNLKKELGASQEEVQMKFSAEAVNMVMQNAVFPLMTTWEKVLRDFDSIVFERKSVFELGGIPNKAEYNGFDEIVAALSELNDDGQTHLSMIIERIVSAKTSLAIGISSHGIINFDDSIFLGEEGIGFEFFSHAYKIHNSANSNVLTKMYHQSLSESEINEIVEALGNKLLESIEEKRN
jgi:hypothetical protein